MKLLSLFAAAAAVLLGSAAPPPQRTVQMVRVSSFPVPETLIPAPPPTIVIPEAPPAPVMVARAAPKPVAAKQVPKKAAAARVKRDVPVPSGADLRVVVSLAEQKAYVFQGGELIATSPVSTGKRGHETPVGTFRILQKKVHHRSSKYDNAPMPYMQRLTSYGIALHAGRLPGYPASHGCIRLPSGFARKLYGMTDHGTPVTVMRSRPKLKRSTSATRA